MTNKPNECKSTGCNNRVAELGYCRSCLNRIDEFANSEPAAPREEAPEEPMLPRADSMQPDIRKQDPRKHREGWFRIGLVAWVVAAIIVQFTIEVVYYRRGGFHTTEEEWIFGLLACLVLLIGFRFFNRTGWITLGILWSSFWLLTFFMSRRPDSIVLWFALIPVAPLAFRLLYTWVFDLRIVLLSENEN